MGAAVSEIINDRQHGAAGKNTGTRAFSCLGDLLACHGRNAPNRNAILAPGRPPMTHGALWALYKDAAHRLRSGEEGRSGVVGGVLPQEPEATLPIIGI